MLAYQPIPFSRHFYGLQKPIQLESCWVSKLGRDFQFKFFFLRVCGSCELVMCFCWLVGDVGDDLMELTSTNRPKDVFFDWFLNPLLIIKDQIKAENLNPTEEDYLGKLVLLSGDHGRMKSSSSIGPPPETERKRAELDALARRYMMIKWMENSAN